MMTFGDDRWDAGVSGDEIRVSLGEEQSSEMEACCPSPYIYDKILFPDPAIKGTHHEIISLIQT